MRALLQKIRQLLRDRRFRRIWYRCVSSIAALVVFITTYALVLPAITMESQAACGIEAHQHDDSCYDEILVCDLEESEGHQHDDTCYTVTQKLACKQNEHTHNAACYDADGNLACEKEEHTHGAECWREERELTCGMEESEGHTHTEKCYEKVLVCGKESHIHSEECYRQDSTAVTASTGNTAVTADTAKVVSDSDAERTEAGPDSEDTGEAPRAVSPENDTEVGKAGNSDSAVAATSGILPETMQKESLSDGFVPELESIDFPGALDQETGFYYFHPGEGQEIPADSGEIMEWKKVSSKTELAPADLVRAYFAYSIPAGSLNETNQVARYRLPSNLHLTDDQIMAINRNVNGIAAAYVEPGTGHVYEEDAANYDKYLGAEAVEGTRTPDQELLDGAQEYISAVVKAENIYENRLDENGNYVDADGRITDGPGAYLGQDLIFIFTPYTIEKNQITYDVDGTPTQRGQKVRGWFACDFNMDQIDWVEDETDLDSSTVEKSAEVVFVPENSERKIKEIKETLNLVGKADDSGNSSLETVDSMPAVTFDDSIRIRGGELATDTTSMDAMTGRTTMEVHVEAEEGTFPKGTTMVLSAVETRDFDAVAEAVQSVVDGKTRGFHAVDISFRNAEGVEIQPLKPIRVSMKSDEIRKAVEDNSTAPLVVHIENQNRTKESDSLENQAGNMAGNQTGNLSVNQTENQTGTGSNSSPERPADLMATTIETTTDSGDADKADQDNKSEDTLTFEADSFSVYAIVYTVDFHWEVNGKKYDYSLPGGGFISLEQLVEVLGIANDEDSKPVVIDTDSENAENEDGENEPVRIDSGITISEKTKAFVSDVETVKFSNPELVWAGKNEKENTVGGLKKENNLEVQYSADLTEERIKEINETKVESGDWALISLQPFKSEETLTVTMTNGDQFVIKVTDAQDPSVYVGKEVIIYDNGEQRAMLSGGYTYDNHYRLNSIPLSEAEGNEASHWTVERHDNKYYLKSSDNRYLTIDGNNVGLVGNWSVATPLGIRAGDSPDYRIYDANNYNNVLTYYTNNNWGDGFFSAPGAANGSAEQRWLYIKVVETIPDRAGDWLLYFDDDFDEITIHVGETISLRPYNKWEWKEGSVDVQTAHWNIGGRNDNYWNQININDANGAHKEDWDDGGTGNTAGFHWTAYVKKDDQLTTHYWAVQGQATKTGDYVLTNTKYGKTITVHVVDGDPVNKPGTINNIANIKVNLFDYDNGGRLDVGSVNGEANHNLANDSNFKNESVNQMGGTDHFYFLSSGSGNNNNESWNSYTKDSSNPNIVKNELDSEGYPVLNHGNNTSLKYLFDTSQRSWHGGSGSNGMIAYPDVVGMFQKDSAGYYYFNSNTNYFYYDTATGTSKLYEHTYTQNSSASKGSLANDKPIGFFPFHDYDSTNDLYVNQNAALNHHVGMSMEVEFMLPNNRLDDNGQPIIFDFSGDDDLWVFVEWVDDNGVKQSKRMLDLGGVHQPIHGQINFTNDNSIEAHRPYTLKVFYLERGGCDSNCSIRFNLPIIQDLTVAKKLTGLTEAEKAKYKDEEFTYEIVVNGQPYTGPNGPEKIVIRNAAGEDITPANFRITNGRVTIKDGQTITISYLDRSDTFSVAEVKTPNMENFETPNAERYYHLEHDASLYEEEIHLTASKTQAEPKTDDWTTPTYELEDTEKVTFTNTLKEKNLEVEKKWKGEKDPPAGITFKVTATVEGTNGSRQPYAVSELKEADGTTDKIFTLNRDNKWRSEIEHLPVNTPDGKFIFYDIEEGQVEGYTLTGLKDITADEYYYCNVDVVKLWPDSNSIHTEVLKVVLKNSEGKYYAGTDENGEAVFETDPELASVYELKPDNNYTHRFDRVPYGEYTAEQLHEDEYSKGLAVYNRAIIQYELENSPLEEPVGPDDKPNEPEIHKRIDALRDGTPNPDSEHADEDLTDLYRLYLDYKVKSLQEESGVDLLFVIDHSGSMNNSVWQGNPYRAPAVEAALNGSDGLISEFLEMNENNQWAAVGFKGPDGAADYYWSLGNPWQPATEKSAYNAGINGSEVLSSGGDSYVFTRNDASPDGKNIDLDDEGPNILTNYTAGFWRAEQFLLKKDVKEDGRKKVIVFISDGIPTLHIDCPNETLAGAGTADGSWYYSDRYGGCPTQTLTEFDYFVNDMTQNGYAFGNNLEFYTIGFGGTMQTETGSQLLNGMLDRAYGEDGHSGHYMTISDTDYNPWYPEDTDYSSAANTLKNDLRTIMGMNEKFSNIVIQDDLSAYVDLYGLAQTGSSAADIMRAAKAKVTMKIPVPNDPYEHQTITLYENGAPVDSEAAKFTRADGTAKANIIQKLEYDATTKTVKAIFDPEYQAVAGNIYTLSFDVKTTDTAYTKYATGGYDKYTEGEKQGQIITGDPDTDFLGTDPDNATSVDKPGFRSNDEAKATYNHNDKDEELVYPHPVIQVAAKVDIVKTDETGAALEGAKFNLYNDKYDASKTIEQNAGCLIEADLQSKKPTNPAGEDAVIRSGKLGVGTYYLVETKAPNGYNSLPGPVKITVADSDGILTMTAEIADLPIGADKLVKVNNVTWKLSLQNTAGYELPSAGGPGTTLLYLLGILLTSLAAAGLIMRKRRWAA